jgi:hypothetical protein
VDNKCPLCSVGEQRKFATDCYSCSNNNCELYSATLSLEAWYQLSALAEIASTYRRESERELHEWNKTRESLLGQPRDETRDEILKFHESLKPRTSA